MRAKETEIKLPVRSAAALRRRLAELGFRVSEPRHLEENILFDTPDGRLRRRGLTLRLRTANGRALLTFKGRAEAVRQYKVRAETETTVSSAAEAAAIFASLGFVPDFRYQKYRTGFRRRGEAGEAVLDETPIGTFLELEGPRPWIRRLAARLGWRPDQFITATYAELYADWRRRHRGPARAMVFRTRS